MMRKTDETQSIACLLHLRRLDAKLFKLLHGSPSGSSPFGSLDHLQWSCVADVTVAFGDEPSDGLHGREATSSDLDEFKTAPFEPAVNRGDVNFLAGNA